MSKLTSIIFAIYIVLGIYFLSLAIQKPFINIDLNEVNGQLVINKPYYPKWAQQQNIAKGDILLSIDQQDPAKNPGVQKYPYIIEAKELSILKEDGTIHTVTITHRDLPAQLFIFIIFPMLYFVLTIFVTLYLWKKNRDNFLTILLILFLLTVSLAYISSIASSRDNSIGILLIGFLIISCLVILIHFLQQYFSYLHIKWPFINSRWLYFFPLIVLCSDFNYVLNPDVRIITANMVLGLFGIFVLCIICILLVSYLQTHSPKIRLIAISLIIPFMPFLLLFVVPKILGRPVILSGEFSALFLLFIPFSFIFIQVNERLLDIEYQLSRFRYYSALAFSISLILTIGILLLLNELESAAKIIGVFSLLFIGILAGFYVKEHLDFKHRKIIFSSNGDYVHNLYAAVNRIGKAKNQLELEARFTHEIANKLGTTAFTIETIKDDLPLSRGEMVIEYKVIQLVLHDTADEKIVLTISNTLQKKELLWLELLSLYFSMFVENLKLIEDLVEEIHHMKVASHTQLPWLDKLLWNIIEKEKTILAQELHDTILQEQLHLARELDVLASNPIIKKERVLEIREQLLDASHDLREYCENLSPPLLDTFGLQVALKKLIQKVKIRANFLLDAQIERVNFQDVTLHLVVYRLVQELLNNAIKHSEATGVTLHLIAIDRGFALKYNDDGIGCNIDEMLESTTSMGIKGIRERVRAFSGDMNIRSMPHEGMHIYIQIQEEGEDKYD
ncbi:sensor histidine kinase [Lysinibacillus sp. NPDC097287]|uniref:sensor histidine kinase n=1 Tax=Lysinibacillus sp. NPDC097287 TaxID=3364144 RepID=UPI003801B471